MLLFFRGSLICFFFYSTNLTNVESFTALECGIIRSITCFIHFLVAGLPKNECYPFVVDGIQVGLVRSDISKYLLQYPNVFRLHSGNIILNPAFKTYDEKTKNVDFVLRDLRSKNVLITLKGWRDEVYRVYFFLNVHFKYIHENFCFRILKCVRHLVLNHSSKWIDQLLVGRHLIKYFNLLKF